MFWINTLLFIHIESQSCFVAFTILTWHVLKHHIHSISFDNINNHNFYSNNLIVSDDISFFFFVIPSLSNVDAAATAPTSATPHTLPLLFAFKSYKDSIFCETEFDPQYQNSQWNCEDLNNFGRTSPKRASEEAGSRMERRILPWTGFGNGSHWDCTQQRLHCSPFNGNTFYFLLL